MQLPEDLKNYCAADYGGDSFLVLDRDEAAFVLCMALLVAAFFLP